MSKPQDFFGAALNNVLAKPFAHFQDQKSTGTDGGATISGFNDRDLNTTLVNGIEGASLGPSTGANHIELLAGTYFIEGSCAAYDTATVSCRLSVRDSDDNVLILGLSSRFGEDTSPQVVSGQITLAETTSIKLSFYTNNTDAKGLGDATSDGLAEAYADFKIWQLDKDIAY